MHRIALLVSPYHFSRIQSALAPYVNSQWSFIPIDMDRSIPQILEKIRSEEATGILTEFHPDLIDPLSTLNKPLAVLFADMIIGKGVCIHIDDFHLGMTAGDYFFNKGLRSFAYLGIKRFHAPEKVNGYESFFKKEGISIATLELDGGDSHPSQADIRQIRNWLKFLQKPVGIFLGDATLSEVLIDACREQSLPIPEMVSILLGEANLLKRELIYPTLSSIEPPWEHIIREAISSLNKLSQNQPVPEDNILIKSNKIKTRASTDFFITQNPLINKALKTIRETQDENLNVQSLVQKIGCDRRTLERLCRKSLNRSPLQIIQNQKLEKARELIEQTQFPLNQIADQCGFSAQDKLSKSFKQKFGETPREWRKARGL